MRSVPLRGFDQEMAAHIVSNPNPTPNPNPNPNPNPDPNPNPNPNQAAHIVTDLEREGVVFVR